MIKLEQQRLYKVNDNEPSWDYVQAIFWQAKCISEFSHDPLYQYPTPLTNQSDKIKRNAHWVCKFDYHMLSNKKIYDKKKTKKQLKTINNKGELK
jgi:hypothetical protein